MKHFDILGKNITGRGTAGAKALTWNPVSVLKEQEETDAVEMEEAAGIEARDATRE